MEVEILRLKKSLKQVLWQVSDRRRYDRCKAAIDMLNMLKMEVVNKQNRQHVVKKYMDLESGLKGGISDLDFDKILDKLEADFIGAIIAPLEIISSVYQDYYQKALSATYSLGNLLYYIVYFHLISGLTAIDFNTFWEAYFKERALKCFAFKDTLYIQQLARKIICGGITGNNEVIILDRVDQLCYYLFGNVKTFKFLYQANLIYEKFTFLQDQDIRYQRKGLTIACSKLNTAAQCLEGTIQLGSQFFIEPSGLVNESRCDNFVTFGKSILADVKFPPDDKLINLLAFAIYFNGKFYYIIDCCRKPSTNLSNLLTPKILYDLKQEMVFSIGGMTNIYIKKIEALENIENELQADDIYPSSLWLEFLGVRLPNGENRKQFLKTFDIVNRQKKTEFIFGKGGTMQQKPDVDCVLGNTSRLHLMVSYKGVDRWKISDLGSTNGTFLLLKNHSELIERKESASLNLFFSDKYDDQDTAEDLEYKKSVENTATLCIAGYNLFVLQQNL